MEGAARVRMQRKLRTHCLARGSLERIHVQESPRLARSNRRMCVRVELGGRQRRSDTDDEAPSPHDHSRQRAGFSAAQALDYPGGDQAALESIIRDERRVELALEGTRIYDIRRWRIAEIVMNAPRRGAKFDLSSGSLDYYEYGNNSFNRNRDYLWAIPRQQWTINQNLGQNDGY